jgi:hypothetical protein
MEFVVAVVGLGGVWFALDVLHWHKQFQGVRKVARTDGLRVIGCHKSNCTRCNACGRLDRLEPKVA